MRHHNSLMHEVLTFVPWGQFERLVEKHGADRNVRALTTKSQFIALLHGQLSGAASLREIVTTMQSHATRLYHLGAVAPKRSCRRRVFNTTLADANALRPAAIYAELFDTMLAQAHRGLRKASQEAVRLIDSSRIRLNALSRDWAHYDATCAGVKLHVVYDPDAAVPVHFAVSPARENDMVQAKAMPVEAGATYVFDLGYYSFSWWASLDAAGCRFVTRLRKTSPTEVLAERIVLKDGPIIADRIVRVRGRLGHTRKNPLARELREIHVVIETGQTLRLVSNDLEAPAEVIADLYQTRWEIELFFRWIKQTLKIKHFLGTSENAVRVQIAVASSPICCCDWRMPPNRPSPVRWPSPGWCAPTSCTADRSTISGNRRRTEHRPIPISWTSRYAEPDSREPRSARTRIVPKARLRRDGRGRRIEGDGCPQVCEYGAANGKPLGLAQLGSL